MLIVQVVPRAGQDAYKLLRDKVTYEAKTWSWSNKAKTRLSHTAIDKGYIEIGSADGIVVAQIRPHTNSDLFFLAEKFIGRLTAWFSDELVAINIQFIEDAKKSKKKKK